MSEGAGLPPWKCDVCGETHDDLPAPTMAAPDAWFHATEEERASEFVLTAAACVWREEHCFVRAVLSIPLVDRTGTFNFGVWSTLSSDNYDRYLDLYDSRERVTLGRMFGWFANRLPGYPNTLNLKCMVQPQEPDLRPTLELEATDHPLAVQQTRGIAFASAVAYLHEHMNL